MAPPGLLWGFELVLRRANGEPSSAPERFGKLAWLFKSLLRTSKVVGCGSLSFDVHQFFQRASKVLGHEPALNFDVHQAVTGHGLFSRYTVLGSALSFLAGRRPGELPSDVMAEMWLPCLSLGAWVVSYSWEPQVSGKPTSRDTGGTRDLGGFP